MPIAVGSRLPDTTFMVITEGGPAARKTADIFAGKTVALFAVPGAYTPTCHAKHLPSFIANIEALKAKGVDTIACTAVNDVFVLNEWGKSQGALGKITFLADGSAHFAKAIGLDIDLGERGLGTRSKRYAMLVKDGVVKALNVEEVPSKMERSSATELLKSL
ncbi:MAG: peroxiredoxin [Hyphomicrobiaceae bacterium]|nr:MAG: peroxiredoxin [Hyphomicrobiaceae bacterium]